MSKILLVDDEPGVLKFLQTVLTRAGHEVLAVNNGREAVGACRSAAFDLLLSDIRMPEMDGHETVRWIASVCPNTRALLMSADALPCDNCPHLPRCNVLRKPLSASDLLAAIDAVLGSEHQATGCS